MKIETYIPGTINRAELATGISEATITTSRGSFSIHELEDGSLSIHESSHYRIAVYPRQANALILEAVER